MAEKKKRRRLSIAGLMIGIAASSPLLFLSLPVLRQGWPTCMPRSEAARWLVANPGTARCASCHEPARVAVNPAGAALSVAKARTGLALVFDPKPTVATSGCPAGVARGPNSCVACHAK